MYKLRHLGWTITIATALGITLLTAQSALAGAAFRVLPLSMSFEPSGRGATRSFQVESTGDEPVALQVQMVKREMKLDGTENYPDADSDFLVYPPQILLKPGSQQTVRVTWLGNPEPEKELAYRVIVEQLPIKVPDPKKEEINQNQVRVNINTLLRYLGAIYIVPKSAAPQLVLDSAVHSKGKNGTDELVVTFNNQGSAHRLLKELKLNLTPTSNDGKIPIGSAVTLKPEQLKGVTGENILAGNKRQFVIPWPKELPVSPVTATFEIE